MSHSDIIKKLFQSNSAVSHWHGGTMLILCPEVNPAKLRKHTQDKQLTGGYMNAEPIRERQNSLQEDETVEERPETTYPCFGQC